MLFLARFLKRGGQGGVINGQKANGATPGPAPEKCQLPIETMAAATGGLSQGRPFVFHAQIWLEHFYREKLIEQGERPS